MKEKLPKHQIMIDYCQPNESTMDARFKRLTFVEMGKKYGVSDQRIREIIYQETRKLLLMSIKNHEVCVNMPDSSGHTEYQGDLNIKIFIWKQHF